MRYALLLIALAAPMVAERIPRDWYECRRAGWDIADCVALWHVKTVADSIWLFQAYNPPERPGPAPETPQAKENEDRRRKAEEVKAYWAEYERRAKQRPTYVYVPQAPQTSATAPEPSWPTPPPLTQPRQSRRQSGQYTERSTVLPGGTIQTLTSDGRQCYTEKLPGGELYTHCY